MKHFSAPGGVRVCVAGEGGLRAGSSLISHAHGGGARPLPVACSESCSPQSHLLSSLPPPPIPQPALWPRDLQWAIVELRRAGVVMNARGCGNTQLATPKCFSAAETTDIHPQRGEEGPGAGVGGGRARRALRTLLEGWVGGPVSRTRPCLQHRPLQELLAPCMPWPPFPLPPPPIHLVLPTGS